MNKLQSQNIVNYSFIKIIFVKSFDFISILNRNLTLLNQNVLLCRHVELNLKSEISSKCLNVDIKKKFIE